MSRESPERGELRSRPALFAPHGWQRVDASTSIVLVRVTGTWFADEPTVLVRPMLEVLAADRTTHHYGVLPGPDGPPRARPEGSPWRAAFALPVAVLDQAQRLVLRAKGAAPAALPLSRPDMASPAETDPPDASEPTTNEPGGAGRDGDVGEDPGQALADTRHALRRSEHERAALGDDHDALVGELSDLHRRLATTDPGSEHHVQDERLAALEAQLAAVELDRRRLREALARAEADAGVATEADGLGRRVTELQRALAASESRQDELVARVRALEAQLAEAIRRARAEAEARDAAEARAAAATGRRHPAGTAADTDAFRDDAPDLARADEALAAADSRADGLQAEVQSAREEVAALQGDLLRARTTIDDARDQLRAETEARMLAEARAERTG